MTRLRLAKRLLALLGIVVIFAGCGGAQSAALPQSQGAMVNHRVQRASGSSGDLIYVSTAKGIVMLSYPAGTVVGKIPWYAHNLDNSICSDPTNGNVFIPEGNLIYEYAHGATAPFATLGVPSGDLEASGCTVDPTTGNLAIIAWLPPRNQNAFLVYLGAQGTPVTYFDKNVNGLTYAAYDDSGDLFSMTGAHNGVRLAELRAGKTTFNFLKFVNCLCSWSKIQWDGKYLAFEYFPGSQRSIGQLSIGRRYATLVNSVQLSELANRGGNFWIYNGSVFAEYQKLRKNNSEGVGVWPYPSGGDATMRIYGGTKGRNDYISDLTVSVAPSSSHKRK